MEITLHRTVGDAARPDFTGIHVWLLDVDASTTGENVDAGVLSPEERARAARLRSAVHRRRFVAAHVAVRRLLGQATGKDPARLNFCYTKFGKPFLAADAESSGAGQAAAAAVRFNLSHSENVLAVGIARAEIGVDVEIIRPEIDIATLAADHLTPAERRLLRALPDAERRRAFFRLWTQKEAAAKAAGRCLRCGPLGGAGRPSAACGTCEVLRQPVAPARPEAWGARTLEARVGDMDVAVSVVVGLL